MDFELYLSLEMTLFSWTTPLPVTIQNLIISKVPILEMACNIHEIKKSPRLMVICNSILSEMYFDLINNGLYVHF